MKKEYATVLAFDVSVYENAAKLAAEYNIKVICKDVIYHLTDDFKLHVKAIKDQRKIDEGDGANFPVRLRQVAHFNKKNPIVMGVSVTRGQLRVGTKLCI